MMIMMPISTITFLVICMVITGCVPLVNGIYAKNYLKKTTR